MGCANSKPDVDAPVRCVGVDYDSEDKERIPEACSHDASKSATDLNVISDGNKSMEKRGTPLMHQVKGILQQLLLIPTEGPAACDVAVRIVQSGLQDVTTVSLSACNKPGAAVLISAHGAGASLLLHKAVTRDQSWSACLAADKALDNPNQQALLYRTVAAHEGADALPEDWALLHREVGLQTFMAIHVVAQGVTHGVLELCSSKAGAFKEPWWEPLLDILCTGIVPLLRSQLMTDLVELMARLEMTTTVQGFMLTLLQGFCGLVQSHTNMPLGVRIGLLSPDGQQVLILHSRRYSSSSAISRDRLPQPRNALARGDSIEDEIAVSRMAVSNTMLGDAVNKKEPRVLRNTVAYLEGVTQPSHDVFIDEEEVVSSIVVVPVIASSEPFGGLYVTNHLPWDEGSGLGRGTAAVVALAALLERSLLNHVAGQHQKTWQDMSTIQNRARGRSGRLDPVTPRNVSQCSQTDWRAVMSGGESSAEGSMQHASPNGLVKEGSLNSIASASAQPVATSSVVEMLRLQVQHRKDRQREKQRENDYVEELELHSLLGKGGFGSVFLGTWKGVPAAIKVMYISQHERALMKNAMEMAVLTTIRHPNIVRVYACLTDMVEEAISGASPSPVEVNRRFRAVRQSQHEQEGHSSLCNLVVMEVCDKGNLRQAIRKGLLHKRTENKGLVVDMRLLVLLEVARSIQHLHSMELLHCDVKAENVLLQSNSSSPTGFTCKLGDFGLVKLLLGKYYVTNRSGSGTVTHLAPELFHAGSKVTSAVDSYSFGIMMFECYTCQRIYAGIGAEAIVKRVVMQQSRPQFPPGTPAAYQRLSESCWAQNKDHRPDFQEIVRQLQALLEAAGGPFAPPLTSGSLFVDPDDSATGNQ